MSVIRCFSVLVASGNGARCGKLRDSIRNELLISEPTTGQLKVTLHKFGKVSNPELHFQISKDIARKISPIFADIDKHFFCQDNVQKEKS